VSREVDLRAVTMGKEAGIGDGNGDGMPRLGEYALLNVHDSRNKVYR